MQRYCFLKDGERSNEDNIQNHARNNCRSKIYLVQLITSPVSFSLLFISILNFNYIFILGQLSLILINLPIEYLNLQTRVPNTHQWSHNNKKKIL